jgi:2'-hydroxyisoflavone reductase
MGNLLQTCKDVSGSDARFVWMPDAFLLEHEAGPWMELPLWIPESQQETAGFLRASSDKAIRDGLTFRPLADTVRDTLEWDRTREPGPDSGTVTGAGMKPEREAELLEMWCGRR